MDSYEQAVRAVQFLGVDAIEASQSGHPGAVMGLAGAGVDLFTRHLRYNPQDPAWPNRDRFVLSCGHASMLLYGLLHLAGYDLPIEDIKNFRQWGSRAPGHPELHLTPGVETTTGPLGQGLANAVGLAMAAKLAGARVNEPGSTLVDYRVFAIASDGDLMEGISSEAASLAGLWELGNLVVIYDDNGITIDGGTNLSFREDVAKRFEAMGWFAQRVDGHSPQEFRAALDAAVAEAGRPSLIITRTQIGYGSPNKAGKASVHGAPLGAAEAAATKRARDWPEEPSFHVPQEARQLFADRAAQNREVYAQWQRALENASPRQRQCWGELVEQRVPEDLLEQLVAAAPAKADATRSSTSKLLQKAAALVPSLIGGSADLFASVKSKIEDAQPAMPPDYQGRNIYFGIREHAMGAICNGLALSGFFIPFGSTFLIFSDYMRPTLRLASLMKLRVLHVFSHDSIFVGEDGPTHQPLEQLGSLRAIPHLDVFRPADALEAAAAWAHAIQRKDGPTVLVTTRQTVPALERPSGFKGSDMLRGAYVVRNAEAPDLVIIATGSEVAVALEAASILAESRHIAVRVISAPCWELFERQPEDYRAALLPAGVRRAAVEAGHTLFWRAQVGLDGITVGVDDFACSAPAELLAERLGLLGPQVAERILAHL